MKGLTVYVLMFFLGALIYMGLGDYIQAHNGPFEPKLTDLDAWVLVRVHLMGLFFSTIGLVGIIKWQCETGLIKTHRQNRTQKQEVKKPCN